MGNEQSHEYDGCTTLGYRVLGVQPNSPASRSGLVSFFDFLVGVNGQLLFDNGEHSDGNGEFFEDLDFVSILKDNVDGEIELLVWNIKSKSQRFINLVPTRNWSGTGLLGVTIRMDDYMTAEDNLLRILDVQPGSPAAMAGLEPNVNYLLGTTMESFESEEVLGDVLYENEDQILEVYVYDTTSDVVRVVTLLPSLKWGGGGLLGAQVGRGYLHRLPKTCRKTLGVSFERKVSSSGLNGENEIVEIHENDCDERGEEKVHDTPMKTTLTKDNDGDNVVKVVQNGVNEEFDQGKKDYDSAVGDSTYTKAKNHKYSPSSTPIDYEHRISAKKSQKTESNVNLNFPSLSIVENKEIEVRNSAVLSPPSEPLPPPPIVLILEDDEISSP